MNHTRRCGSVTVTWGAAEESHTEKHVSLCWPSAGITAELMLCSCYTVSCPLGSGKQGVLKIRVPVSTHSTEAKAKNPHSMERPSNTMGEPNKDSVKLRGNVGETHGPMMTGNQTRHRWLCLGWGKQSYLKGKNRQEAPNETRVSRRCIKTKPATVK